MSASVAACCASGSSPLTRGKRLTPDAWQQLVRLIPAHAGKTRAVVQTGGARTAHPRSRGENYMPTLKAMVDGGSSPLTRGKPSSPPPRPRRRRLIPAHAGKTRSLTRIVWWSPAHPRSRGENVRGAVYSPTSAGSSPLTRGKRGRREPTRWVQRLIPAHAGKTFASSTPPSAYPAHPRSRGENVRDGGLAGRGEGSSPLTRGKPPTPGRRCRLGWLIPAHAGKTPIAGDNL